jgi:hypothetical protein
LIAAGRNIIHGARLEGAVMTKRNVILGVLVLAVQALTSFSVAAQIGDSAYRYFLVPLMVTGPPETGADPLPGAHGSLWSSRLLAFNEGDTPIQLTIGGDHCPIICFGPTFWQIHPEQVLSLDGVWLERPAGLNGYSNETGERLARVPVTLSPARPLHTAMSNFPAEPGFAYIPDVRELAGTEETSVRVEVAFPPGLKFWTFASVTHNETQHVTIVTP